MIQKATMMNGGTEPEAADVFIFVWFCGFKAFLNVSLIHLKKMESIIIQIVI